MSLFGFSAKGDLHSTEAWLRSLAGPSFGQKLRPLLERYGQEGVQALRGATPKDTSETAYAWYYEIVDDGKSISIIWGNNHVVDGRPIAVLIQLGHGTGTGGYVQGRDYINPALRPVFDRIANEAQKVVNSA